MLRSKKGIVAGLLGVLIWVSAASVWPVPTGRVCYVATDGADSNPGTEAQPGETVTIGGKEA